MKLNGTHQLLVYSDDVILLGRSISKLKEKAEAFVVPNKEIRLEVNANKSTYLVMSRDQNVRRSHSVKIDNSTFERVEELKYLVINLTNQNSIYEEIESRSYSGNAYYNSVQNLLSSSFLIKT